MATLPLSIIIDDKRSDVLLLTGPRPWTSSLEPEWFNGTSQSPTFALDNSGLFGTLQLKFRGIAVAFFGVTPPVFKGSQNVMVSIDENSPYTTSYSDPNPQTYRQWYQTPTLKDGNHVIELSHVAGTSFDFAVVTVGNSTDLTNETIIVDNDDPGITFDGSWRRSQDMFNSGPQPDGFPYHNTTHQTSAQGSSFTYNFSGRSAAIYGVFSWADLGLLSLSFTLDGASLSQTYRVNEETPQFVSELGQQPNFLFYSYDFLQPGNHTLVVNVTTCINQTFAFDYITYRPSFSSLRTMPDPSSNSVIGENTATRKGYIAGIIGSAIGTLVVLILFGLVIVCCKRRRTTNGAYQPLVYPFAPQRTDITNLPLQSRRRSQQPGSIFPSETLALNHRFSTIEPPMTPTTADQPRPLPNLLLRPQATTPGHSAPSSPRALDIGDSGPSTLFEVRSSHHNNSDRDSLVSVYGEAAPPSYDETTRGHPPPASVFER